MSSKKHRDVGQFKVASLKALAVAALIAWAPAVANDGVADHGVADHGVADHGVESPVETASQTVSQTESAVSKGDRALELELRHQMNRSLPDAMQQSLVWRGEFERGSAAFGGRLTEESVELDRFVYFGEVAYRPLSFVSLNTRLLQTARVADGSGTTVAMFTLGLCAPFSRSVSLCVEGGPQRRWIQIDKTAWLPLAYRSAFSEAGAVLRFDLKVRWNDRWSSSLMASNFENIDVYYLHSPFFQLSIKRAKVLDDGDLIVFGRYHVLLGFGILDNWTTGVGLNFPI